MFAFVSIIIENFKSYRGKHEFKFPVEPGLYFITGRNTVDDKLGSNGAGKSTILDAIYWCLYGRTLRGLKAGDVISWGTKSCAVTLSMVVGDQDIVVKRTQNPNSLLLDGVIVEQEAVTKAVRLTPESFVYSVMMPQFNQSFFERTPTEKLNLFSDILNLNYWLDLSKKATAVVADLDISLGKYEQTIEDCERQLVSLADELKNLEARSERFAEEKQSAIEDLKQQLAKLIGRMRREVDRRQDAEQELDRLTEEREKRANESDRLTIKKADYLGRREDYSARMAASNVRLEAAKKALAQLKKLGPSCPTCLQKIDATHMKREKNDLFSQIEIAELELKELNSESDATKRFITKIWADITELDAVIKDLDKAINAAKSDMSVSQSAIDVANSQEQNLRASIVKEEGRENPYQAIIEAKTQELARIEKIRVDTQYMFAQIEQHHTATEYWINGFKRVRLYLIEETLKAFEIEVNNCLTSLGMSDWQVELDIERENKSGGITKGFTVTVKSPDNRQPIKLEAWSGGEGQRIQMAGDLGLANLIMQQHGLEGGVEFYDEPSAHLSQEGLLDLAETLHQRAINQGKVVFLIDHHTIEFGDFTHTYTIVKGEKGSYIS